MPKIRIKKASASYLERFANKSYSTDPNGVTTFTTSGMLNSNYKKVLDNFYNSGGKYFKIEQLSKNGNLTDESDFFDDSSTIEFIESTKNNRILDVPVVKIENTDDYYITSDPGLLSQNTITLEEAKHAHLRVSDRLVSSPNFIDFNSFSENSVPSAKTLSKTKENVKEEDFSPFIEEDIFENVSDSFLSESFVYEDEEYHLGNEQRIEIELDFSNSSDPYLVNTQLFYRTNNFFDSLDSNNDEPEVLPDDVFLTDQVNFLSNESNKEAISSHFIPNAIWNNTQNRWEYNLTSLEEDIDKNEKINPYLYNKSLFESPFFPRSYDYPSLITHSHNFARSEDSKEGVVNENIFKILNYMSTSSIAFSSFSDIKNSLKLNNDRYYTPNIPLKTYGFPNSPAWHTGDDHSINMSKYLTGDFLLEKVIFEGTANIKAETPKLKGNFVNHYQDYEGHPSHSDLVSDDAILFTNNTEFNEPHVLNDNTNQYTATGINFYLLNKKKSERLKSQTPDIKGYVFSRNTNVKKYSDYQLSANDLNNPIVDTTLNDIKNIQSIDLYEGNWINKNYTGDNYLKYEPVKSSTNVFTQIDEFNNITDTRLFNKFYYLEDADLDNIDTTTKTYFTIKQGNINETTRIYDSIATNDISKEIKDSQITIDSNVQNDLITHDNIVFISKNNDNFELSSERINSNNVTIDSLGYVNYNNYSFKISNYIKKNSVIGKFTGESSFNIVSNYQYLDSDSNVNSQYDSVTVLEEKQDDLSERFLFTNITESSDSNDIVSSSGKILSKDEPEFYNENIGYLLKKSDDIVVGINSFTGFNNIISYASLKDKLKITLIGREAQKTNKNESYYSNSIKKSFSGNQKNDMLQKKNKIGKYFSKQITNNREYLSDSVLPNIFDIYFDLANKQIEEYTQNDSLDWFVNLDNYNSPKTSLTNKTEKLIFSNKTYQGDLHNNVVSDWHDTFYMSKYKNSDVVSIKQIKNVNALIREKNVSNDTYLYFDIDSYSLSNKYDLSSSIWFNDILSLSLANTFNANDSFITIRKFLKPINYYAHFVPFFLTLPTPSETVREYALGHSGVDFLSINNENNNLTKDKLINDSITYSERNHLASIEIGNTASGVSIQYMSIPAKIPSYFNDDSQFYSNNKFTLKSSWVLVLEQPIETSTNFYKLINKFKDKKYSDKLAYRQIRKLQGTEEALIMYDYTFKIGVSYRNAADNMQKEYFHDFFVVQKYDSSLSNGLTTSEKIFVIIPLQHLNSSKDIDTPFSVIQNEFYDIDLATFTQMELVKDNFRSFGNNFDIIPKTYEEMFVENPKDFSSDLFDFSKSNSSSISPRQAQTVHIHQYVSEIDGLYRNSPALSNPVSNYVRDEVLNKNITTKKFYNAKNNLSLFNIIERKLFAINSEYYDTLDLIISKENKSNTLINKIISTGIIYKKKNNTFVKTKNRVLYEVLNVTEYKNNTDDDVRTFMNVIGLLNAKGEYDENDLSCMLLYDINNTDVIRIYDEKILEQSNKFKLNINVPYVEINMSVEKINNIADDDDDGIEDSIIRAIKYSHYSTTNYDLVPQDVAELKTYGSPIAKIDDLNKINNFLYSYSRNKKYSFPIDQTSGFRYGVYNPTPVNTSYYFNANHYGQFKDRSYDTQNYSMVKYVNDRLVENHCIRKRYYDNTMTFIEEHIAAERDTFDGSNTDLFDRVYHPFIESNDGSDMSYLYT